MLRAILIGVLVVLLLAAFGIWALGAGWLGSHEGPGVVAAPQRPSANTAARGRAVASADRIPARADADSNTFSIRIEAVIP